MLVCIAKSLFNDLMITEEKSQKDYGSFCCSMVLSVSMGIRGTVTINKIDVAIMER